MEFIRSKRVSWRPYFELAIRFGIVFFIIFWAAKFGQNIFFEWKTSPAVLWPPTGIGVAIIWLYGYRYAFPIFLGLLAASVTGPIGHIFPAVLTTPLGQIAGQLAGVYLLRRLKFEGSFTNIRNVLVFFVCIILLSLVSPTVTTTVSYFAGNITGSTFVFFSRIWAGYAFSCLILTPFFIAWVLKDQYEHNNRLAEAVFAGALLTVSTYLLFWTRLPADYGFVMFALYFLAVIWVCLRFSSRIVTLSVVYITVFGILGLFVSPAPNQPLNGQVFASELFLFIVVPIMYVYSALVKERHKNMQELKHALSSIEAENANKTNFISVLAHELRNPLSPIKTTLEILKLKEQDTELQQLIHSAYNQVHVMRRLLDDLLDVARVTQGKFNLKKKTVALMPLLLSAIEATRSFVAEHEQTLVLESGPEEIQVDVDPVRFEQVVVNIINNAAKFTKPGGTITISYKVADSCLELRIKDTGKGIAEENLEKIFNSFWQINDTSYSAAGIGVGLALARQIVELHNGSIRAESGGLGKGSTFVISIPYNTAPAYIPEKKEAENVTMKNYTILVVDDNKPAANALAQLLSIKGHTAHTVYSGGGVSSLIEELSPDIVLLDIGLPDISGYDVARNLREQGFAGGLIALSGYGQQEDKEKAIQAGFDTHFTKPLAIVNLETYLSTWKKTS